jgi:hypothetical protein
VGDEFSFRATKDGKVLIERHGRRITVLAGERARRFLRRTEGAEPQAIQLELARVTGNYKHGNERR